MAVDVALEKLSVSGVMQLTVTLDRDIVFPHVSSASVSFVEKYEHYVDV